VTDQRLEHVCRAGGVGREEAFGGSHRLTGLDQRGEVQAGVEAAVGDHGIELPWLGDIDLDEAGAVRDRVAVAGRQVVGDGHLVTGREEGCGRGRADEPGSAGHQGPHAHLLRRASTCDCLH
jgi:hypothetical protein